MTHSYTPLICFHRQVTMETFIHLYPRETLECSIDILERVNKLVLCDTTLPPAKYGAASPSRLLDRTQIAKQLIQLPPTSISWPLAVVDHLWLGRNLRSLCLYGRGMVDVS